MMNVDPLLYTGGVPRVIYIYVCLNPVKMFALSSLIIYKEGALYCQADVFL